MLRPEKTLLADEAHELAAVGVLALVPGQLGGALEGPLTALERLG